MQLRQRLMKGFEAKVAFAGGAIQPVQERRKVNQLGTRFEVVEVEQLLTIHGGPFARSMAVAMSSHKSNSPGL